MTSVPAKIDGRKTEAFREAARARAMARWTPEARAIAAERAATQWTAEARAAAGARTRALLADPAVRQRQTEGIRRSRMRPDVIQRIALGTRAGMARAGAAAIDRMRAGGKLGQEKLRQRELAALHIAWAKARKTMRARFLTEIGVAAEFAASADLPARAAPERRRLASANGSADSCPGAAKPARGVPMAAALPSAIEEGEATRLPGK